MAAGSCQVNSAVPGRGSEDAKMGMVTPSVLAGEKGSVVTQGLRYSLVLREEVHYVVCLWYVCMVAFSAGGLLIVRHGKERRHPDGRRQHQLLFIAISG